MSTMLGEWTATEIQDACFESLGYPVQMVCTFSEASSIEEFLRYGIYV